MGSFGLPDQRLYGYENTPPGMDPAIELLEPLSDVPAAFVPWQHYGMYRSSFPLGIAQGQQTAEFYGSNPSEGRSWDDGTTLVKGPAAALRCLRCQTAIHPSGGPAEANFKGTAGGFYFGADEGHDRVQDNADVAGVAPAVAGGDAVHHSVAYAYAQTYLQSPEGRELSGPSLGPSLFCGRDRQPNVDGHLCQARGCAATPSRGGLGVEAKTRGAARGAGGEVKVKQRGVPRKYRGPTKTRKGPVPRYSCAMAGCAETFTTWKDLERHQTQSLAHPETFEAQYRCDDRRCGSWGRIFTRKDNFDRHVKTLHAELR